MSAKHSKRRRGSLTSQHELTNVGIKVDDLQAPARLSRQNLERLPGPDWKSSTSMMGTQNSEGKMLLLPLSRPMASISRASERNRTTHACDLCRKAKAKCTGGQPCQECKNKGKDCVYGDGKRDKERKFLQKARTENETLRTHSETLRDCLQRIGESSRLTEFEHNEISELLAKSLTLFSDNDDDQASVASPNYPDQHRGEDDATGDVGSACSLDAIDVDTTRDLKAQNTGFLGKSSEVRWSQRAEKEAHDDPDPDGFRSELACYHTGDPDYYKVTREEVSKYELPTHAIATALVETYFTHVHPDFPILSKDDFMQKFRQCTEDRKKNFSEHDHLTLCQINCVFAISSTYVNLTADTHIDGDHRDHLKYYARVRALGLEQQPFGAVSSLDYISPLGLLGLYLASNYYVNRAWNVIGSAVRHAVALGLHIRSEAAQLSNYEKDNRNRIWWSIFSLEHLMNEITGRPSCISYSDISAPHPVNPYNQDLEGSSTLEPSKPSTKRKKSNEIDKGKRRAAELQRSRLIRGISTLAHTPQFASSTTTNYFSQRLALNVLTHEILNRLFCASVVDLKWHTVQDMIRDIDRRLSEWESSLPDELALFSGISEDNENWRERKGLAVTYHTARMILHRPALCRMEGRIHNESSKSQQFNRDAVRNCVDSARASLATIGPPADLAKIYLIQPWWEVLHHVCQAASILMLEIAFCASHIPHEATEILQEAKDAVHWLRIMSRQSISARKAWQAHDRTLRIVAMKINADISDMKYDAEIPPGWGSASSANPATASNEEENIPGQGLTGHQAQNLAATNAWVQSGTALPGTGQAYMANEYPDLQPYLEPGYISTAWDPYTYYDTPGFPWYEQRQYFMDQSQGMQAATSYQYGNELNQPGPGIGGPILQDPSLESQDESLTRGSYHNAQGSFHTKGSYIPQ